MYRPSYQVYIRFSPWSAVWEVSGSSQDVVLMGVCLFDLFQHSEKRSPFNRRSMHESRHSATAVLVLVKKRNIFKKKIENETYQVSFLLSSSNVYFFPRRGIITSVRLKEPLGFHLIHYYLFVYMQSHITMKSNYDVLQY